MAHTITAQELTTLSTKAIDAKATAYCPYSKFRVGACILTTSGEFIAGANVENASYPVGTCAERVTIGTAIVCSLFSFPALTHHVVGNLLQLFSIIVVAGHRDFKALAVATDIKPAASPCGMCRQFIREFTSPSFPVYMYDGEGDYKVMTLEEVSFFSFFSFFLDISVWYLFGSLLMNLVAARLFRPRPSSIGIGMFTEFMDIKEKRARGLEV
ncbi:unnamed protein product [Penicillium egyptiacum]|uniref:CMP/dCMP-type deaminase domain-containing protein n=1 Tax=Penicillium egyptiacum TaxID=1303716 RepID=A0A9W4K7G3_9EURO|nr:unnamed protein product [Penicillium egyptiacum]